MLKVVIISINDLGSFGARCISSVLKSKGFDVQLVFFDNSRLSDIKKRDDRSYQALISLVGLLAPDIVGISFISIFSHPTGVEIARRIKKAFDVPVIFGGVHPTLMPGFCMDNARIDYVCVGEGEESMLELCQSLSAGYSTSDIPGIFSRGKDGYIPRNPPANLDALPFQDIGNDNKFSILPDGEIKPGDPFLNGLMTRFVTRCSRGCPFGCAYCSSAGIRELYDAGKYLRRRSAAGVVDEIKYLMSLNPVNMEGIWFTDDIFPDDIKWIEEFSSLYKKDLKLPFSIWAHPIKTREQNIKNLKEVGLTEAVMGIQSASITTRRRIFKRGETTQQIVDAIGILHRHGVRAVVDFVVDHPWESPDELRDIFDFTINIKKPIVLNMHSLSIFPNTGLAARAVREGIMTEGEIISRLLDDPYDGVRKYGWRASRSIPAYKDTKRTLWVFLVMCAQNPEIPKRFLMFAADSGIINKYPVLVVDNQVMSYYNLAEFIDRSPLVKKLSKILPLNRFYFAAWFILRIAARMPAIAVYGKAFGLPKTQHLLSQRKLGIFSFYKALREITRLFNVIDTFGDEGRKIYIWGAGQFGRGTLKTLLEIGVKISGFIDGNESLAGTQILGYTVFSRKIINENIRHFIIVGSMYFPEIEKELNLSGYGKYKDYWTNVVF